MVNTQDIHITTPESSFPKLNAYTILSVTFTFAFVIVKAILGFKNKSVLANAFDVVLGVGGVILICIGLFEKANIVHLKWLFERDYLRFWSRIRSSSVEDAEVPTGMTQLQSREGSGSLTMTSSRERVDISGLRRRVRWQRNEEPENLDESLRQHRHHIEPDLLRQLDPAVDENHTAVDPILPRAHISGALPITRSTQLKEARFRPRLNQTISAHRAALAIPSAHPSRYIGLNSLATALMGRFEDIKHRPDLDEAIMLYSHSLYETPWGHPDHFVNLYNVTTALQTRFKHFKDTKDLDEAIFKFRQTVKLQNTTKLSEPSDSIPFLNLTNLANALMTRFEHLNYDIDLDEAIAFYQAAVDLTDISHPDRPLGLQNLANSLLVRFRHTHDQTDLENAISRNRIALELTPEGHPDRPFSLNSLSNALLVYFEEEKDPRILEEAISNDRVALDSTPESDPYRSEVRESLAKSLLLRFKLLGDCVDLDECIRNYRCALAFLPPDPFTRRAIFSNIALALLSRFQHFKDPKDLGEAIAYNRIAVKPTGEQYHATVKMPEERKAMAAGMSLFQSTPPDLVAPGGELLSHPVEPSNPVHSKFAPLFGSRSPAPHEIKEDISVALEFPSIPWNWKHHHYSTVGPDEVLVDSKLMGRSQRNGYLNSSRFSTAKASNDAWGIENVPKITHAPLTTLSAPQPVPGRSIGWDPEQGGLTDFQDHGSLEPILSDLDPEAAYTEDTYSSQMGPARAFTSLSQFHEIDALHDWRPFSELILTGEESETVLFEDLPTSPDGWSQFQVLCHELDLGYYWTAVGDEMDGITIVTVSLFCKAPPFTIFPLETFSSSGQSRYWTACGPSERQAREEAANMSLQELLPPLASLADSDDSDSDHEEVDGRT